jgi:hypothetical protein
MGLLDDAIRQHLELKRQHGAPEEELKRQEEEALGPARRDVAPAETTDGDGQVELEEAPEGTPAGHAEPVADEPPGAEVVAEPHEEATVLQEPPAEEPAAGLDAADERETAFATPVESDSAAEVEPASAPEPPAAGRYDAADDDDADFFLDDEPPPSAAEDHEAAEDDEGTEGEEDVLQDTPDFLQDTPEHDRLWFEQKPPRDFDFD